MRPRRIRSSFPVSFGPRSTVTRMIHPPASFVRWWRLSSVIPERISGGGRRGSAGAHHPGDLPELPTWTPSAAAGESREPGGCRNFPWADVIQSLAGPIVDAEVQLAWIGQGALDSRDVVLRRVSCEEFPPVQIARFPADQPRESSAPVALPRVRASDFRAGLFGGSESGSRRSTLQGIPHSPFTTLRIDWIACFSPH